MDEDELPRTARPQFHRAYSQPRRTADDPSAPQLARRNSTHFAALPQGSGAVSGPHDAEPSVSRPMPPASTGRISPDRPAKHSTVPAKTHRSSTSGGRRPSTSSGIPDHLPVSSKSASAPSSEPQPLKRSASSAASHGDREPPIPRLASAIEAMVPVMDAKRSVIAPWEDFPAPHAPVTLSNGVLLSGESRPFAQATEVPESGTLREEVTPWEFFPTPKYEEKPATTPKELQSPSKSRKSMLYTSIASPRQAGRSSGTGLHLRITGRRKSTGNKTRYTSSESTTELPQRKAVSTPSDNDLSQTAPRRSMASTRHVMSRTQYGTPPSVSSSPSVPVLPELPDFTQTFSSRLSESGSGPPREFVPLARQSQDRLPTHRKYSTADVSMGSLKFSTADRTILKELRQHMDARATQFAWKGVGRGPEVGVGTRPGQRHHPYPSQEVPYPRAYSRKVLNLDVWETIYFQQMCGSPTWHVFETEPTKVLDIGCGTGTWLLTCARAWQDCHFVGLDVVPLHPDLQQIGSSDLAERINWVQANFLEGLPFPNGEFDFVHIKRIAMGVPEDKWDFLFEEITRVMKPGAAFEMVEEDLFFPGKVPDGDSADSEDECPSPGQAAADGRHSVGSTEAAAKSDNTTQTQHGVPTATVNTPVPPAYHIDDLPSEVSPDEIDSYVEKLAVGAQEALVTDASDPLAPKVPLARYVPPSLNLLPASSVAHSSSYDSTMSVASTHVSSPLVSPAASTHQQSRTLVSATATPSTVVEHTCSDQAPQRTSEKVSPTPHSSVFAENMPPNPRDHSLLEIIYNEMHASRFVNLSPLSLLANSLGLYFKVRTHPPFTFTFPPPLVANAEEPESESSDAESSDSDKDARDVAYVPHVFERGPTKRSLSVIPQSPPPSDQNSPTDEQGSVNRRWVSMTNLARGIGAKKGSKHTPAMPPSKSVFSALDVKRRVSGKKPVRNMSVAADDTLRQPSRINAAPGKVAPQERVPEVTMMVDRRISGLHLAMKVAEVMACAESMWEWVIEFQQSQAKGKEKSREGPRSSVDHPGYRPQLSHAFLDSAEMAKTLILDLTRDDFDHLFARFHMDMTNKIGLANAVETRFHMSTFPPAPSTERKSFDAACEKWDQWVQQHPDDAVGHGIRHQTRSSIATTKSNPEYFPRHEPGKSHAQSQAGKSTPSVPLRRADSKKSRKSDGPRGRSLPKRSSKAVQRSMSCGSHVSSKSTALPCRPEERRLSRVLRVFIGWKALDAS